MGHFIPRSYTQAVRLVSGIFIVIGENDDDTGRSQQVCSRKYKEISCPPERVSFIGVGRGRSFLTRTASKTLVSTNTIMVFCMVKCFFEIGRYINTINLQIDVTKFLYRYLENLNTVQETMSPSATPSSSPFGVGKFQPHLSPPTLFNNTKIKAEVVNLVSFRRRPLLDGGRRCQEKSN